MSIWSAASTIPTICGSVGAPPACALALAGCSPTANMIAAAADKALMDGIGWLFIVFFFCLLVGFLFFFFFVCWLVCFLFVGLWRFFWNGSVMWLPANAPAF